MAQFNFEMRADVSAAEHIADLIEALESLREDVPWRDEIDQAIDAAVSIANNMMVIQDDRVIGRIVANKEGL